VIPVIVMMKLIIVITIIIVVIIITVIIIIIIIIIIIVIIINIKISIILMISPPRFSRLSVVVDARAATPPSLTRGRSPAFRAVRQGRRAAADKALSPSSLHD
jgi:hypothetical protein